MITALQRKSLGEKDWDRMLTEVESLSDEEANRQLADMSENGTRKN